MIKCKTFLIFFVHNCKCLSLQDSQKTSHIEDALKCTSTKLSLCHISSYGTGGLTYTSSHMEIVQATGEGETKKKT